MSELVGGLREISSNGAMKHAGDGVRSVLIMHPNRLMREALVVALSHWRCIRVLGSLADVARLAVLPGARRLLPDVVIIGRDGSDQQDVGLLRTLRTLCGPIRVILLHTHTEASVVDALPGVDAVRIRRLRPGFSLQTVARIVAATPRRTSGHPPNHPAPSSGSSPLQPDPQPPRVPPLPVCLTAREAEVWRLRQQGLSYKAIATTLTIEVQTAKNHARTVSLKLRLSQQAQKPAGAGTTAGPP